MIHDHVGMRAEAFIGHRIIDADLFDPSRVEMRRCRSRFSPKTLVWRTSPLASKR